MSYSPRHAGNPPQPQAFDPWDRTPLYAPDNFGQTPTSPVCSPPANQIFDEHLNSPEFYNIPLARQSSIVTRKIPRWVKYDMATRLCIIFF